MKFKRKGEHSTLSGLVNHRHKQWNRMVDGKKFLENDENNYGNFLGNDVLMKKPEIKLSVLQKCSQSKCQTSEQNAKFVVQTNCNLAGTVLNKPVPIPPEKEFDDSNKSSKLSNGESSLTVPCTNSYGYDSIEKSVRPFSKKNLIGRVKQSKRSERKSSKRDPLNRRLLVAAKSGFLSQIKDSVDFSSLVRSVSFSKKSRKPAPVAAENLRTESSLKEGNETKSAKDFAVQPVCLNLVNKSGAHCTYSDMSGARQRPSLVFRDSLPFDTDLSPTVGDMYGNDEVDHVMFEKFENGTHVSDSGFNSDLNKLNENKMSEERIKAFNANKEKINAKRKPEIVISFDDELSEAVKLDEGMEEVPKNTSWNTDEMGSVDNEEKAEWNKTDGVRSEHCQSNEIPWIKQSQKCDVESMQYRFNDCNYLDEESTHDMHETSLGFEVNLALKRTDSNISLNSFGSSVHSVNSDQDVYFSDSEAEHNIINRFKSPSDSETSKSRQIIPYSLAEKVSGDKVTVRRKKKGSGGKTSDKSSESVDKETGKVSLFKSVSLGWNEEKAGKKSKHVRRSLDPSLMQRHVEKEIDKAKQKMNRRSEEFVKPVSESKTSKDNCKTKESLEKLDPNRFFTLPNPKKLKAQNLKKKLGRIGSMSKLLSDKANSFSNLKMDATFKIRKEIEKSKSLVSSSANSLSDMMSRKASSFSTLIRRRANSNTALESPFKQYGKKKAPKKPEDPVELVYEKVCARAPTKGTSDPHEEQARLKRFKVKLKLARRLSVEEDNKTILDTLRSRSLGDGLLSQGSSSSLRVPTLLDELLKSVDAEHVKQLCSVGNEDDDDLSDYEESSSGSSLFLFQKQYSFDSECTDTRSLKDSSLLSVCRVCGKIRTRSGDRGNETFDICFSRMSALSSRFAMSLCDLNSRCSCNRRGQTQNRKGVVIHGSDLRMEKSSAIDRESVSSVKSSEGLFINDSSCIIRSNRRSSSMHDFRRSDLSDFDCNKSMNDLDETDFRKSIEVSDALPGTLYRHKPVLDLSGENLDVTIDSEDGLTDSVVDEFAHRSRSCGDLVESEKYFTEGIPLNDIAKSIVNKDKADNDSESFHSCSESIATEKDIEDIEDVTESVSRSCCDLLDPKISEHSDDFKLLGDQTKKELRKVKVKSMSSSHDALSVLVPMETMNIDEFDFGNTLNQPCFTDLKSELKNHSDIDKEIYLNDSAKNFDDEKRDCKPFCDNESTTDSLESHDHCYTLSNGVPYISSKPPLPPNRVHSLSDLTKGVSNKNKEISDIPKRSSMIEFDKENLDNDKWMANDVNVKKKKKKQRSVLGTSDELNCCRSANLETPTSKFLFDDKHVQNYLKSVSLSDKPKSVSSDNVCAIEESVSHDRTRVASALSLRQLSTQTSTSDEVFNKLTFPTGLPFTPFSDIIEPMPLKLGYHGVASPGFLPELSSLTEDFEYKYDICLGYLLHSVQCDDMVVCFYSPQRNKQLMESVITPLSATPQIPQRKISDHGSGSRHKVPNKPKAEEIPNPAAPITNVPSERLVHAGHVLRTVLLARAPYMIRDRKFHLRTYRRCMVGTEMVDWLVQQSSLVHSRTQAVGMWQALVEEGIVVHGKFVLF